MNVVVIIDEYRGGHTECNTVVIGNLTGTEIQNIIDDTKKKYTTRDQEPQMYKEIKQKIEESGCTIYKVYDDEHRAYW